LLDDILADARGRMESALDALGHNFNKIRTGRAHPSLLDGIKVPYYGADTPLNQMANVNVEDARTLSLTAWDRSLIPEIERAILKSDLGLNPATAGEVIRIPMPALTEETRKGYIKQARSEAEAARVSVRNARRDAMGLLKEMVKRKGNQRRRRAAWAGSDVQKLTDGFVARIEEHAGGPRKRTSSKSDCTTMSEHGIRCGCCERARGRIRLGPYRTAPAARHVAIIMDGNNRWARAAQAAGALQGTAPASRPCAA
jgi:ribosome recycling factor